MEGVLERTDTIQQLTAQVEQLGKQLKKVGGDMQTLERENVHLKQKVEVEKFKSDLDSVKQKSKMAGTLFEKRLDDNLSMLTKRRPRCNKRQINRLTFSSIYEAVKK